MVQTKEVEQRLEDMVHGFDSLVSEMQALRSQNQSLHRQLDSTLEKPSTPATTEDGEERDMGLKTCPVNHANAESDSVQKAREVAHGWKNQRRATVPKIELPQGHPEVEVERDFTTPGGTPGILGCPFAAMMGEKEGSKNTTEIKAGRKGRKPGQPSMTPSGQIRDPIAAEFHSNSAQSQAISSSDSIPQCPIRFLDQHKPEEVAQYFENHKHEIPRSHEVCIRRYQGDEQSVRQLDAKYGNMVSMIQGLGKKHQPILEERVDRDEEDADSLALSDREMAKIQKWAGGVEDKQPSPEPGVLSEEAKKSSEDQEAEGERQQRFDRELREVRLGESPSRPWGIQVPAEAEEKAESIVDRGAIPEEPTDLKDTEDTLTGSKAATSTSITFNGPVFFGYSADDMARLFQQVPELAKMAKPS